MIYKKLIILITITLIFLNIQGCSNSKKTIQTSLPKWYMNSPLNTSRTLYGTGEANSLNEAKTNALNNMSQQLVVSVQSSMNTITKSSSNSYSKELIRDIKLSAKKITFSNYKVQKVVQSGNSFFVLLSVNRIKLFNEKQKELNTLDIKIETSLTNMQNSTKIEQIYNLEQLKPTILEARNLAFTLYAINNQFDYQSYYSKYDKHLNNINLLKNSLVIKLVSNTKNTMYIEYLKELLNKNNYKTSTSNEDVLIKISNNIRYSIARAWQIAKVSTTLDVLANNKSISTNTISTIGRSTSSKQNALASSAKQFKKKINTIGINKILFNK